MIARLPLPVFGVLAVTHGEMCMVRPASGQDHLPLHRCTGDRSREARPSCGLLEGCSPAVCQIAAVRRPAERANRERYQVRPQHRHDLPLVAVCGSSQSRFGESIRRKHSAWVTLRRKDAALLAACERFIPHLFNMQRNVAIETLAHYRQGAEKAKTQRPSNQQALL